MWKWNNVELWTDSKAKGGWVREPKNQPPKVKVATESVCLPPSTPFISQYKNGVVLVFPSFIYFFKILLRLKSSIS